MTLTEFAATLDGRECPLTIMPKDTRTARENGLVIVYGASDDLMEFAGAIDDEVGCYNGGVAYLRDGDVINPETICDAYDERRPCKLLKAYLDECRTIKAYWCDGVADWCYETDIPHETFRVMEDGNIYCVGIVFRVEDI